MYFLNTEQSMHRIDTSTAQRDKFGQGKNGFTRGNPQTGTPATQLDYLYCDAIQEEIANAIESAGIKLDKSKHDQLATAIKEFVKKGSVKLNSATDSTSETEAATPLAVKKVNDIADDANTKAQQAFELTQTMTPNSRKINNKSLDNDVSLNANDVGAIPAQKNNGNDYFTHCNLNFALRPRVNNSPVVTIDQFTDYKNPTIGWYALPNGYIHQFGTVILPPIEEYNVVTISGIKYYTQVYKILLPRSYPTAQVATTVTLVGSPFNGQQANEFGVWARNNRGSDGVNSGVSKSSFDVSITSKALGYVPVIHFSSDGY